LRIKGKKTIVLAIVTVFLLGLASSAGATPFKDMDGHWADKDVSRMYAKGIVAGYGEEYRPNENINREQAIVMLIRAMGLTGEATGLTLPANFSNPQSVTQDFRPIITLAINKKILSTTDIFDFRPKESIKRHEIAVFIARAMGFEGGTGSVLTFVDAKEINDLAPYAAPFISYVNKEGIMVGDVENRFKPANEVTRAEMATMLTRIDNKLKRVTANTIKGEVFSPSSSSVLVKDADEQIITLVLDAKADIFKDNNRVGISGLVKGDKLEAIKNAQGQVVYLEVIPADKFTYDRRTVTGTIDKIMLGSPVVFTVNTSLGLTNYSLKSNAKITVDGLAAQVTDVLPGQKVTLVVEGNDIVELDGENAEREVRGEIRAVTFGFFPSITIQDEGSSPVTYSLNNQVRIEMDGRVSDGQDLAIGQQVRAMVVGTEITRLWASSFVDEVKGNFIRLDFFPKEVIVLRVEVAKGVWEEQSFEVAENATVRRDRRVAALRDLRKGDVLEIDLKNNRAVSIYAEKLIMDTEGRIVSITLSRTPLLTIMDSSGQEWQFEVAPDAKLRKERDNIAVTDLRIDDYVSIRVEGESIVSLQAENRMVKDYLIGVVDRVTRDSQVISLEIIGGNAQGVGVYTDRYTRFIKFGNDIRLQDLAVGDVIFVLGKTEGYTFAAETVVVISAAE